MSRCKLETGQYLHAAVWTDISMLASLSEGLTGHMNLMTINAQIVLELTGYVESIVTENLRLIRVIHASAGCCQQAPQSDCSPAFLRIQELSSLPAVMLLHGLWSGHDGRMCSDLFLAALGILTSSGSGRACA